MQGSGSGGRRGLATGVATLAGRVLRERDPTHPHLNTRVAGRREREGAPEGRERGERERFPIRHVGDAALCVLPVTR